MEIYELEIMGYQRSLYERIRSRLGFLPTDCQERLFLSLSNFIAGNDSEQILLINGYAGTGKTSAIGALVKALSEFSHKFVLLAPTGRAAKVLSGYTGHQVYTVHKHIYRQKSLQDGIGIFTLNVNRAKGTLFIVDEVSLISNSSKESQFGSGNLLRDLVEFVNFDKGNKLILLGDSAQLPPVGSTISDAMDLSVLKSYGIVAFVELLTVVRQAEESGILYNATILRRIIESGSAIYPKFRLHPFGDIESITGADLIEKLSDSYDRYGEEETLVLCRSNKMANRYNNGIRGVVLNKEEKLTRGDRVMVVKNCYKFVDALDSVDFIANGDVAEILKISNYEERYGLLFADAKISFSDYDDLEIGVKIILDTLISETPSLSVEQQRRLFMEIMNDYSHIRGKKKRITAVREDSYFNALQIKFSAAITCHKSQGGQWKSVFIDNPFWQNTISIEDLKWLYTALTRAVDRVYLVNFNPSFFE